MAKPFDASLKALIDAGPADWVRLLAPRVGLTPGPAEPVDTDLPVTTVQSDRAVRLVGPPAAILHIELQSTPRLGIPTDLHYYNTLLARGRAEDVYSVVVLLRPKAAASDLTGVYRRANLEFRYAVVRAWELLVDDVIAGGPATAPLALLTDEATRDIAAVGDRIDARLRQPDVGGRMRQELWSFAGVFGALRFDKDFVKQFVRRYGVLLEESSILQEAVQIGMDRGRAEGRAEEARKFVLSQARRRFGAAPAAEAALHGIADTARLERIFDRLLDAAGWDDLLSTP